MFWRTLVFILFFVCVNGVNKYQNRWTIVSAPPVRVYACNDNQYCLMTYNDGNDNLYYLTILEDLLKDSSIVLKFDQPTDLNLTKPNVAAIRSSHDFEYNIVILKSISHLTMLIKGLRRTISYPISIKINTVEYCEKPNQGALDGYLNQSALSSLTIPRKSCGRRKPYAELVTNGFNTKPGDWPWHVALYRSQGAVTQYICGGTLISKTVVITAGHCVMSEGALLAKEVLSVALGKYDLIGGDRNSQTIRIHDIIIHEKFKSTPLDNDIALLKLEAEAMYSEYIQPACIWNTNETYLGKLQNTQINGMLSCWLGNYGKWSTVYCSSPSHYADGFGSGLFKKQIRF